MGLEGSALRRGLQCHDVSPHRGLEHRRHRALEADLWSARGQVQPVEARLAHAERRAVGFGYLDSVADAQEYQGRNLTDAWIEEAGQYPTPEPIFRLFGALRSSAGVPTQLVLTGNPGGPGQSWIRDRYEMVPFPKAPKVLTKPLQDGSSHKLAVIPSRLSDNKLLLKLDPNYVHRLQLVGKEALVRAWLDGDWNAVEGAFFDEWSEARHVVEPFALPRDWLRFRAMDWGSASPFSVGWWAVAGDEHPLGEGASSRAARSCATANGMARQRPTPG